MEGASFRSPRGSYATGMYMQARRIKGGAPAPGAPPPRSYAAVELPSISSEYILMYHL